MPLRVEQPVVTVVLDRRLKLQNPGHVLEKTRPLQKEGCDYLEPKYLRGAQFAVDEGADDG